MYIIRILPIHYIIFFLRRRPQLFIPQPRYTNVLFNPEHSSPSPILNNAQRFVNSYLPAQASNQPIPAQPIKEYFVPSQVLSSQNLPGFGLRYFSPVYAREAPEVKGLKDDAQYNQVESKNVDGGNNDVQSDLLWKYEKDVLNRISRSTLEVSKFA